MISQALVTVVVFIALMALLPLAIKKYRLRLPGGATAADRGATKLLSVLPIGQQQRIVSIEVGPAAQRTVLVLGVTAHSITTLHSLPVVPAEPEIAVTPSAQAELASGADHGHA